ncbi:MAG: GntR family transcriptional regulator [Gordonia sp. (in: high G+C Gram-positive bacteria)]
MSFAYNQQRATEFQKQRLLSRAPLHTSSRRTYEQLRASIRAGLADTDTRFHELSISRDFGASRNSVRVALTMLVADGLISRAPRRGTVVKNRLVVFQLNQILPRDFTPDPRDEGYALGVVNLQNGVMATPPLVKDLMRTEAMLCLSYVQLGVYGDEPIFLRTGVAPLFVAPDEFMCRLNEIEGTVTAEHPLVPPQFDDGLDPAAYTQALRERFEADFERLYGTSFGRLSNRVELLPADSRTARLLGVAAGSPLLMRQQYSFDSEDRAREYSFTHFRGDRVTLSNDGVRLLPVAGAR